MLSKNKIKFINSLKKKKNRTYYKLFLAEGEKIILELLASSMKLKELYGTEAFMNNVSKQKLSHVEKVETINDTELKKISDLKTPNKVLAIVEIPKYQIDENELKNSLSLVLDKINDPGNLGTIIRIADWFGINHVFCSEDTVDVFNPKVIQSTMGSFARVNLVYCDLKDLLSSYQNTKYFGIYGSFLEGESIYASPLTNKGFIIMGSESHGISKELEEFVNQRIYIPSFSQEESQESSESLNVSVATGIICSEFRRQNREASSS